MVLLLILKLWATGASLVAGHNTRSATGPDVAAQTESIPLQADLAAPPEEPAQLGVDAPQTRVAANDDAEAALGSRWPETPPPLLSPPLARGRRRSRVRPPHRRAPPDRAAAPPIPRLI